jgi:hypothetical protein
MPSRDKSRGKMFREGFETAVARWNAARSDYSDAHMPEKSISYGSAAASIMPLT